LHLRRLEMQGFKSFPDKIEIRFEDGITAIVGPNGSGKSNVADAIRWVLGEQSAKQLRGAKMEDVIFNGTQKRKAQSYCEVTLVFDNADHGLSIDFSEVAVTRRMYRDGKSEYYINKNACRLRDVIDLFRDTGIGKEGYSIIGQGRIDEILSNKAEDRRAVFEEASGVAKFKADRAEALRSLSRTQDNLVRIDDILEELHAQVEPLRQQSEDARQYLVLRDQLRYEEVNLFLHQTQRNQQRVSEQNALAQQLQDELALNEQNRNALQTQEEALFETIRQQEAHAVQLREQMVAATAQEQEGRGQLKVLQERLAAGAREKARIDADEKEKSTRQAQIVTQLETLTSSSADADAVQQQRREELAALEAEFKTQGCLLQQQEMQLEKTKEDMIRRLNRMSDLKSRRSQLETMRTSLEERMHSVADEVEIAVRQEELAAQELEQERASVQEAQDRQSVVEAQRNTLLSQIAELSRQERSTRDRMHQLHDELGQSRARIKMLRQMKQDYEGFNTCVRNLLRDASSKASLKDCVCGVVAELIDVPQKFEKAIEVALGGALQNIVTPDENDAKRLIQHLRARQYGRATFLPLSGIQSRSLNAHEQATLHANGCFGAASTLVSYDPVYRPAIENLLGRVVIVEDLDAGIALARQNRYSFRIVTLAGDVLNSGGSMTGGSVQSRSTSILSRDRQIAQEQKHLESLERESGEFAQECEQIEREARTCTQRLKALEDELGTLRVTLGQHQERADILSEHHKTRQQQLTRMRSQQTELEESLADVCKNLCELDDTSRLEQDASNATDEDVSVMQQALYRQRSAYEQQRQTIESLRIALSSDEAQQEGIAQRIAMLQQELARIRQERAHAAQQLASIDQTAEQDRKVMQDQQSQMHDTAAALQQLRDALQEADKQRTASTEQSAALSQKRVQLQEESDSLTQRLHKAQLQKTRIEAETQALHERIWNEYELTLASVQPLRDEKFQPVGAPGRIAKLKTDIRGLGDVNVGSIEQYATVSERVQTLSAEREDLTQAKANLEEVIVQFESEIKTRFKTQFARINDNFKTVFSQLFNGGTAELRLTDPDDLMETGVDIVAQPPGKKLQALSLLSGGERTLTAIAILFAMLNIKPTPFCVLDEIEAALDEANTGMYADFLKDYSSKTQFVIITHRKESMEVSDAMYGIAMQERGISSLVSVKLTDAQDQKGA
jgi:chromosome segregation protein